MNASGKPAFDEKNIRRRVYDALNVLMAMEIVSKEKKEIRWKGLPTNAQHDRDALEREQHRLQFSIQRSIEHLGQLMEQQVCVCVAIFRHILSHASLSSSPSFSLYVSLSLYFLSLFFLSIKT